MATVGRVDLASRIVRYPERLRIDPQLPHLGTGSRTACPTSLVLIVPGIWAGAYDAEADFIRNNMVIDEHFEGSLGSSANSSTFRSNREQRWIAQRYGENVGCVFCSEGIESGCQGSSRVVRSRRSSAGHRAPSVSGCVRFAPQVGYKKMPSISQVADHRL
jgi:hypothetical protein